MSRKRFISSNMSRDEDLADIAENNPLLALMWPWFLTAFDDWGRLDVTSARQVKLDIFPAFPISTETVEEAINSFERVGIAYKYTVDNRRYLAIEPCKYYSYQTYIKDKKRNEVNSKCPSPLNPPWENCAHCRALIINSADSRGFGTENVPSPSPSPSPSFNEEEEKNNDVVEEKEKDKSLHDENFKKVIQYYNKSIHPVTRPEAEQLSDWLNLMEAEVIMYAIREAVTHSAFNLAYINSVLSDWLNQGIKTKDSIEALLRNRKCKNLTREVKSNGSSSRDAPENNKFSKIINKSNFLAPGTANL